MKGLEEEDSKVWEQRHFELHRGCENAVGEQQEEKLEK
jgi:hypothetical protein